MCDTYGTNSICPPHTPTVQECREFFSEYSHIAILRIEKVADDPENEHIEFKEIDENLLALEREIFLAGYYKAMALPMTICYWCDECQDDGNCKQNSKSRPTPEALGVDVFETVRNIDYPAEVLTDYTEKMNRYAFLLVK